MRIKVQFKDNTFPLSDSALTFEELRRIVEASPEIHLSEHQDIQYFVEVEEGLKSLDEELYKSLVEKARSFNEIKIQVEEKFIEESSNLTFSNREYENNSGQDLFKSLDKRNEAQTAGQRLKDCEDEEKKHKNSKPFYLFSSFDDTVINQTNVEEEKLNLRNNYGQINHKPEERTNKNQDLIAHSIAELEERFREGLEDESLENVEELNEQLEKKSQDLADYRAKNKEKKVKELEPEVQKLQSLLFLYEEIQERKRSSVSPLAKELEQLENQLREGLDKEELENLEELNEELEKKSQELIAWRAKNREKKVKELELKVQELQTLQSIYERIQELKRPPVNLIQQDIELKEAQLKEGLEKEELENLAELNEELEKRSQELAAWRAKNREKKVKELELKVQELQSLQSLDQEIQGLKQSYFNKPLLEEIKDQNQQLDQSGSIPIGSVESNNTETDFEMPSQTKRLTEIENLEDDIACYPDCVERSLLKLKYFTILSSNPEDFAKYGRVLSDQADQEIQQELMNLRKRNSQEDLSMSDEINNIEKDIHHKEWKEVEIDINKALKKVRPLDIPELFRLISYSQSAATLIEGKDVILFLGGTGAGKSTTIHYLAGSIMQVTKVNGVDHISPKKITTSHLEKVTTSSSSKSETRYITSIPVDLDKLDTENSGQVILCDTPGFGDTAGPEVDIANALSIVEAIKKSASVKPVILVSYRSIGDRYQGLKSIAHILAGMIPSLEAYIKCVSYLFTKYPENQRESIHASIRNVKDDLTEEERSDTGFFSLFKGMFGKTKKGACVVNPLNSKESNDILDELMDSKSIPNPRDVFKFSLSESSLLVLQDQARRHELNIKNSLDKFDYDLTKFRLDELRKLLRLLDEDWLGTIYIKCTRDIGSRLNDQYQTAIDKMNRCLTEDNGLNENDVEEYDSYINYAKAADILKKDHLEKSVIESSAYMQNLKIQLEKILKSIKKKKIDEPSLKKILDKIRLLAQIFPEGEQTYRKACETLEYSFLECTKSFKLCQASEKFEDCGNELTRLQMSLKLFNDHWENEDKQKTYEQLKKNLVEEIKTMTENQETLLTKPELNDKDIKMLNEWICKLEAIISEQTLRQHIPKEEFDSIYEQLCAKILVYYGNINSKIQEIFQKDKEKAFVTIEVLFKEMVLIRKIPTIQRSTSESYAKTLSTLCGFIENIKRDVILEIELMDTRTTDVDSNKICDYIKGLENSKWISQFVGEQFSSIMENVKIRVIEYCELSRDKIRLTPLDFKNSEKIQEVYQRVTRIESMEGFEKLFSGLQLINNEIKQIFYEKVKENILFIKEYFKKLQGDQKNHKSFNFVKFEIMLVYLRVCKDVITSSTLAKETLSEIENALQNYRQHISEEMNELFDRITNFKQHAEFSNASPDSRPSSIFDEEEDRMSIIGESKNLQEIIQYPGETSPTKKIDLPDVKPPKELVLERGKILASRLKELKEIYEKCPSVLELFGSDHNLLEEWKKKLEVNHSEMSHEMNKFLLQDQFENFDDFLLISKALGKLDDYLTSTCKYSLLCREFQNRFYQQAPESCAGVIQHIRLHEYENVSTFMAQLESTSENNDVCRQQLNKLKLILNNSLEDFMDQLESQTRLTFIGNNLNPEKIRPIIQDLKKIRKAGDYVEDFLNKEVLSKLENCENNIRKTIELGLKRLLKSLNNSIAQYNFFEVNQQKQIVNIICEELGSFCSDDVLEEMSKLDETENNILNDLEKKYEKLEVKDFIVQPPKDIFARFEKLPAHFSHQKYNEVQGSIKNHILIQFRKSIKDVRSQTSGEMLNSSIRRIESALNTLPNEMKNILKTEIDDCKDEIKNTKHDHEKILRIIINGNDWRRAASLIQECRKMNNDSLIRQLEEHCLERASKLKSEITQRIESKKIKEVWNELKSLNEFKDNLGKSFRYLVTYWTEIEDYIEGVSNEKFSLFMKDIKQEIGFLGESSSVEEDVNYLTDFSELLNTCHTQKVVFSKTFLETFHCKFIEMNTTLADYFKKLNKKYLDALNKADINALAIPLKSIQIWNKALQRIKTYAKRGFHIDDTKKSFETLTEVLAQVEPFEKVRTAVVGIVQTMKQELDNERLINDKTKKVKISRDEYYESLNKKMANFMKITALEGLNIETGNLINESMAKFQGQAMNLYTSTENLLKQIFEEKEIRLDDLKQLDINLNNILSLEEFLKVLKKVEFSFEKIELEFFNNLSKWERIIENNTHSDHGHLMLIKMKMLAENLEALKLEIDRKINELLQSFKQKHKATGIVRLGQQLNLDNTGYGQRILRDYKCFQGFSLSLFNTSTKAYGINKVLENLKGDGIDKALLGSRYSDFEVVYKELVKKNLKRKPELSQLISNTKMIAGVTTEDSLTDSWRVEMAPKVPRLLAHICAVWTLQNAEHYFEASELDDKDSYLLQPHAAQVISIFRLLGIGESKEVLKNNLVQIGTGEGKSVTIAVTALIFALFGFEVSCACYSSYLSERDFETFKSLFETFNVSRNIHYGNFNKLNEDSLNKNGDIRQLVREFISQEVAKLPIKNKSLRDGRILLIDEVDVFFSKDFYGGLYTPSTELIDPAIEALIDMIWRTKNHSRSFDRIKRTQEYQHCCSKFKGWEFLIEEAVKDMLFDLKAYESHDYIVKDDKIGYAEHEQISFKISYRYQTLFAYYAEHEKGTISEASLKKNKNLRIKCGHFSYAEIPNQFEFIMGVTGTLETLNKAERAVIEKRYNILKNTFTPSVFGETHFQFDQKTDVFIENADDYYLKIRREIEQKIFGRGKGKRAVLVFFESAKRLNECLESLAFQDFRDQIEVLTEEANSQERETRVRRATSSGQITFLTKIFGRGTDFICQDETVDKNDGIHVLQTFVSEEFSEEVQIRGRTARQGKLGSYSMVLLESSLEKFLIKKEDIANVKKGKNIVEKVFSVFNFGGKKYDTTYELINERRNELFESQFGENEKFVDAAKAYHDKSLAFLDALHTSNMKVIKGFLLMENKGTSEAQKSRTMVLMDATGSMSQLLHKAKKSVGTMFDRACKVLKDNGIAEDSFQIQFAVYRNYNEREDKILQSSVWETKPDNLRSFMENIDSSGGKGNEAIEIGFWHANNEHEKESISQVILIGDADANTESEVTKYRAEFGEAYWASTKFAQKTFWKEEAEKLRQNNIPIHAFYVDSDAKSNFTEIATFTKGRCEFLDVNSSEGAETLVNLVTETLLKSVGQQNGKGDSLVEAYRNVFIKSYN